MDLTLKKKKKRKLAAVAGNVADKPVASSSDLEGASLLDAALVRKKKKRKLKGATEKAISTKEEEEA